MIFLIGKKWGGHQKAFLMAQKRFPNMFNGNLINTDSTSPSPEIKIVPETIKPKSTKKRRIVFGEPIDFRGLRFAPVNEQGVVYLFGMIVPVHSLHSIDCNSLPI